MKKNKLFSLLMLLLLVALSFGLSSCGDEEESTDSPSVPTEDTIIDPVDYAGSITLNMNSNTKKAEVDVKLYIDGDTVHFNINEKTFPSSLIKARFLAVNTPESTGKIEPYGKKASNFTKDKLLNAESIIVESDDHKWNADSTGDRYLLWIWYRETATSPYRNLNIELLQEGLSIASNSGQNRYGTVCTNALNQARVLKLNCFSKQPDPNFYYGDAKEITLRELRTDVKAYEGVKVAFTGIVFRDDNNSVYVQSYFEDEDIYYGISVYYGTGSVGKLLEMLQVGNEVRVVGTVTEFQGSYQVSGLSYNIIKPNDPNNTQAISENNEIVYSLLNASDFANKKVNVVKENEEGEVIEKDYKLAELLTNTAVQMQGLQVVSIYTTNNEDSSSNGAMTLTCKVGDITISVRTNVLYDADGKLITALTYQGKNINVKGMVDCYNGTYQIKVFSAKDITFN